MLLHHLVQDFDSDLLNFDVISERININFSISGDWMHVNGVDYRSDLNQIAISVPRFSEI
ncbi:MAG: hypothetical protein ACI841_005292 [Planctomycetota bacterium]